MSEIKVDDIFRDLKEFAKKHKAQFLCIFWFPDKQGGLFRSEEEGNARMLIDKYLEFDKNSNRYIKK